MKKLLYIIPILLLLFGFGIGNPDPTVYYVNTAADAGGDGTTQELTGEHCAFKTIAQVNAASPAAGDSVLFNKGNEWREKLEVPTSGSDGSQITFGAYGTGVDPIINGALVATDWTARGLDLVGWNYRKKITIQSANIDGNLSDFPVYVDITADGDIGSNISDSTNGYDIRFTDADGETLLKYEREYFNVDAEVATGHFWVKVPNVYASPTGTQNEIYIYYNDGDGTIDGEDAANVWDDNYKLVMHLKEASGHPQDSSGNANHAIDETITSYQATGKIKYGVEMSGSSTFIEVADSDDFIVTAYTQQMWAEPDNVDVEEHFFTFYASGEGIQMSQSTTADGRWRVKAWDDLFNSGLNSDAAPTQSFECIAAVREADETTRLYVDGSAQAASGSLSGTISSTSNVIIGASQGKTLPFDGVLDEVRFSNVARSANWLKFEFANINNTDDNELDWGAETAGAVGYYILNINPHQGYSHMGMIRVDDTTVLTYNADKDNLAEGEYHHNTTDDDLYIRLSGDADPAEHTIEYDDQYASFIGTGKDYITVDGLHFRGGFGGIRIQDGCDHWIIQNCTIRYNSEKGIKVQGDNIECTYNTIQDNNIQYCGYGADSGLSSYGIQITSDVANPSSNNVVQNNFIKYCRKGAFSLRHADSNIWRYNESHVTGESCVFHDDSDSNEWYYNIFDHDGWNDGDSVFYLTSSLNNEFYNNVIISNGNDLGIKCYAASTGTKFKNNIYYGSSRCISVSDGSETNFESDYNCLYVTGATFATWMGVNKTTFADWKTASSQDAHSIDDDPLMIDPANNNFHLNPHSPCVNAGTDVSLTEDYEGLKIRHAPDIGAHENQANVLFFSWFLRDFLGVNK